MNLKFLSSINLTAWLSIIYLLLYVPLLNQVPTIMMDEPWYANTAYNFVNGNGFINTNVGYRGGDVFVFFPFLMGIGFKILGCTLWTARFISLIGGLFALIGLLKIFKGFKLSNKLSLIGGLLFLVSNISFVIFRSARPEGLVLTFGIWSIYFLIRYLQQRTLRNLILLSLFSSMAFLIHPNGILFLLNSGFVVLYTSLKNKNYFQIGVFIFSSLLIVIIPFALVFSNPDNLNELLTHAQQRTGVKNTGGIIDNFLTFYSTYTLGIKRFYLLFFELAVLIISLFIRKNKFIMLFGMMGLFNFIISMAVFNPYINRSFGEITIFSYICFILLLNHLKSIKYTNRILLFAGIIYLLNSFAGDAFILNKKSKDLSYATLSKELSEITASNKNIKVLTIIHLWFPFKDREFYCKQTNFKYKKYDNWDDLLKNAGIDFVITSNLPVKGATGTSGRSEKISGDELKFFNLSEKYAEENGTLIKTIEGGSAYGLIKVYKIRGGGN